MYVSGTPEYLVGMEGEDRNLDIRMTAFLRRDQKDLQKKSWKYINQEARFQYQETCRKNNQFQDLVQV